jgi:hypothetical protein
VTIASFSSGFDNGFEIATVAAPSPDGDGFDTRRLLEASPRRVRVVQLEGQLLIALVGVGELTVTIDEDLAAALRNVGALMMLGETTLAEIAAAAVNSHRAERVRNAVATGDPLIVIAEVEAALTERSEQ